MQVLKLKNYDDAPSDSPYDSSAEVRKIYLDSCSHKILHLLWLLPSQDEVSRVAEADVKGASYCGLSDGM